MKKTVQINIIGVIFSIEEDAYHKLSEYMRSIQQYFASFDGSLEIIQDIESRIVEKFLAYQKEDQTKVITLTEVDQLIQSMGTVADFEAIEEEQEHTQPNPSSADIKTPKRIFRDTQRKAISGVLAGLANHLNVDVTWVRIIFLVLFFGGAPLSEGGLTGFLFLAYIVCWIAFPPNARLEENRDIKKFYRNPEGQVIGGVASGLATYFGLDVAVIRLLFVLGVLFFGTGLMLYIVLWIVSPRANSLTQKMELKGEPVTLENIESNVRQTLQNNPTAPENSLTRVVLLPFRALGLFLQALGTLFKRLGPVVRILVGLFLAFIGLVFLFTTLVMTAVFFGLMTSGTWIQLPGEAWAVLREMSPWTGFFFFLAAFLPGLAITASGISLIFNKSIRNRTLWLSGLGLWMVGIIGLSVIGTTYSLNFAQRNSWEQTTNFTTPASTLYLTVDESDLEDEYAWDDINIDIEGTTDNTVSLNTEYIAKGATREEALRHAQAIRYSVLQQDSILQFASSIQVSIASPLRNQQVRGILKVPIGKPFRMSPEFFSDLLRNRWEIRKQNNVETENIDKYTFVFAPDRSLTCLDCPQLTEEEKEAWDDRQDWEEDSFDFPSSENLEANRKFDAAGFTAIEAERNFQIIIKKGDTFSVIARSGSEKILNNISAEVLGETLQLSFEDPFITTRSTLVFFEITMPTIDGLELSGASQAKVIGFTNIPTLSVSLSGASKAAVSASINDLTLDLSGASQVSLIGQAERLSADVSGASRVKGTGLKVQEAAIEASGASQVDLGKVGRLKQSSSGASTIQTQ